MELAERLERPGGAGHLHRIVALVRQRRHLGQRGDGVGLAKDVLQQPEFKRGFTRRCAGCYGPEGGLRLGVTAGGDGGTGLQGDDQRIAAVHFLGKRVDLVVTTFNQRPGELLQRLRWTSRRLRGPEGRDREERK